MSAFTRNLDHLGRVCLPKEMRIAAGLKEDEPVEIKLVDGNIILSRVRDKCERCGKTINLVHSGNLCICEECIEELAVNIERK